MWGGLGDHSISIQDLDVKGGKLKETGEQLALTSARYLVSGNRSLHLVSGNRSLHKKYDFVTTRHKFHVYKDCVGPHEIYHVQP